MTRLGDHVISSIHSGEGIRQGQLVNWYLSEIEGDIDSVEMLAEKKVLVEKVIERLIHHVRTRHQRKLYKMKFFMSFHKSCGQVIPQLSMYILTPTMFCPKFATINFERAMFLPFWVGVEIHTS